MPFLAIFLILFQSKKKKKLIYRWYILNYNLIYGEYY